VDRKLFIQGDEDEPQKLLKQNPATNKAITSEGTSSTVNKNFSNKTESQATKTTPS
jgi:hypothetical protein